MAECKPPAGLVPLQAALDGKKNVDIDIMGVVTDFRPALRTRGTDYQCSFTLTDSSFAHDPYGGVYVKFFRKELEQLPKIQGTGDVVTLRHIKIKEWRGETNALSNSLTEWIVYPAGGIPEKASQLKTSQLQYFASNRKLRVSPAEQLYAVTLCNSQDRSSFTAPEVAPEKSADTVVRIAAKDETPRNRFSLIKDLEFNKYYDIVGQVARVYNGSRGAYTLYITDYTTNGLLYEYEWDHEDVGPLSRDGDEFAYAPAGKERQDKSWPGPWGRQVLQVTLWHPHAGYAQENVKVGDNVSLRNLYVKLSNSTRLEGSLHTDQRYAERINISVITHDDDERVKKVLERKRAYWKKVSKRQLAMQEDNKGLLKRRRGGEEDEPEKKSKGKRRRNASNRQAAEAVESNAPDKRIELGPENGLNKHVRSSRLAVRPTPLADIINNPHHENKISSDITYRLPFQNICFRACVRVVDFYPPNLADFSVPKGSSEYDVLSDDDNGGSSDSDSNSATSILGPSSSTADPTAWEWRFYLLLEDANAKASDPTNARMKVLVAQLDAEMLLKSSAENLHRSPSALASLREKLFILWGDLEEGKAAASDKALAERDPNSGPRGSTSAADIPPQKPAATSVVSPGAAPSARPFECCIKEYGTPLRRADELTGDVDPDTAWTGWQKRWRMFGTTIM